MRNRIRRHGPAALVALVLLALAAVLISPWSGEPDKAPAPQTITHETKTGTIKAPVEAVEEAKSDGEAGLGHETQTPRDDLHNDAKASPRAPRIVGPVPLASSNQPGCTTRQNQHNYSYRNGVRPSLVVPHLTVAPNRPGWGDANGIAIYLDRAATQASANYIIDNEGHCLYTVPESLKAWTQANFNSATACSFEVQNTGNEASYAGSAGLNKLARVTHDCAKRWGIPFRRAQVSGSRVIRSGFIDHLHLLAAGGGHVDIRRFGAGCLNAGVAADTWRCVDLIIAKARALDGPPPAPANVRAWCGGVKRYRDQAAALRKRGEHPGAGATRLAQQRKALAAKRGYKCGSRDGRSVAVKS